MGDIESLLARMGKLEKRLDATEMEWMEWFDKFRRLYARIAKRQERDERDEEPVKQQEPEPIDITRPTRRRNY